MISVGIFGRRAAAGLLAAGLLAAPALCRADGVMLVQAGAFWMGRDDGSPDEAPLHRVYVRDFWIDRDKVTNAELAFERHPAVEVSWFGARDYCPWKGRRLPTEAE